MRIYEWQPSTLHAKTFVVDGLWSSVATMNFDDRSLALNGAVALMALVPEFGRRKEAMFGEPWPLPHVGGFDGPY